MDHDLARAVTQLPGWRWMPGMLTANGERVLAVYADLVRYYCAEEDIAESSRDLFGPEAVPDLDDEATGGLCLHLLGPAADARSWLVDGTLMWCCSLGVACARVAVAIGRWPGGGA